MPTSKPPAKRHRCLGNQTFEEWLVNERTPTRKATQRALKRKGKALRPDQHRDTPKG